MPISELVNDILEHCDIYQKKKNGVNKKVGGGGGMGGNEIPHVAEMRVLRWISGNTRKDRI